MSRHQETLGERYDIGEIISAGTTAKVVRALDRRLDREVAIKMPRRSFAETYQDFRTLFVKEATLLSGLNHPNIIPLYDYHESPQGPVLVMRYVRSNFGACMQKMQTVQNPTTQDQVIGILNQVASAVDFCAERGHSHRDVKPDNILIDEWGHSYLIDFGFSARLDDDEKWKKPIGAMPYVSPEALFDPQSTGGASRRDRADQFALGVVAYESLTGHRPLDAAAPGKYSADWGECTALRLLRGEHTIPSHQRNPTLPPGVDGVLRRMLSLDPGERYHCAKTSISALSDAVQLRDVNGISLMVSYSRTDEQFVRTLVPELRKLGYSIWFDGSIDPGRDWDDQIEEAMLAASAMIVVLSPDFTNSSEAKHEWKYWLKEIERPLIPIQLVKCRPPYRLSSLQRVVVGERTPAEIAAALHSALRVACHQSEDPAKEKMPKGAPWAAGSEEPYGETSGEDADPSPSGVVPKRARTIIGGLHSMAIRPPDWGGPALIRRDASQITRIPESRFLDVRLALGTTKWIPRLPAT